jgi:hypothetical protein
MTENEEQTDKCCDQPTCNAAQFDIYEMGTDRSHQRYGEVRVYTCKKCQKIWLNYFIEKDYSNSGRWYRGQVTRERLQELTPETVVNYLEHLSYYYCGGSFFNTTGKISSGPLRLD